MDEAKKENEVAEAQDASSEDTSAAAQTAEVHEAVEAKAAEDTPVAGSANFGDLAYLTEVRSDLPHIKPGDI